MRNTAVHEQIESALGESGAGEGLRSALMRLRARARLLLLGRALAGVLGPMLAIVLLVGTLDYSLRLPAALRVGLWLVGVAAFVRVVREHVLPAARFSPRLSDLALRVEASRGARADGLLASALEIPASAGDERAREVRSRVRERLREIGPWHVLEPARSRTIFSAFGAALLVSIVLIALSPRLTGIGAARVLMPWSGATWPKRSSVIDTTLAGEVHPLGVSLDLSADLERSPGRVEQARVVAMVRLVRHGEAEETRRLPMSFVGGGEDARGFQRRVDIPPADDAGGLAIDYWIVSGDASTEVRRIRLEATPEVVGATLTIEPPAYAREIVRESGVAIVGEHDLGEGADERALAGPILAGSAFTMEITINKALPSLRAGGEPPAWIVPLGAEDVELLGDRVVARGTIAGGRRVEVALEDEHGLVNAVASAFSLDVIEDAMPTASVSQPASDEGVLASALIAASGEGVDDVALEEVAIERRIARSPRGSEGAPPEGGEGEVIASRDLRLEPAGSRRRGVVRTELDLAPLGLTPGDEVWIRAIARDAFEIDGRRNEAGLSQVRRLVIIGQDELVERLRRDLDAIREAAQRLDEAQARVERLGERLGPSEALAQQQREIGEQVRAQRDAARRIGERIARNRLDDDALSGMVEDGGEALESAGNSADEAGEQIERSAREGRTPEGDRAIERAQRTVRDELGRLAQMLSRGQDEWLVRRDVERLLGEQRRLSEQTASIGRRTAGRSAGELSGEELSELDRIAQRQREIADELAQTLDDLNERAREMGESDPGQSAAMQQAADRGRRSQAEEAMREASAQVGQNQTGMAGQNQQRAQEALEGMLEDLESAQANRDAALQRVLASVIESIEGLIRVQKSEIAALAEIEGRGGEDLASLEGPMARLFANTLGVLDQARAQGGDLASVGDLIAQASEAQERAIAGLGEDDADRAREGEQASLSRLEEAKAEAERLDEEAASRDAARKRAELTRAYRDALEQQSALRSEAEPMADRELARRERQAARSLGERQGVLRATLDEVRSATEELDESEMFEFAHERLDALMAAAAATLSEGRATRATIRQQDSAIRVLRSILDALKDAQQEDDPFRQGAGGASGQGGSGEQPLIPPIAELKLLRAMQEEALELTRELDEAPARDASEIESLASLQEQLRERGRALIEKMSERGGGSPAGARPGDENGQGGGR